MKPIARLRPSPSGQLSAPRGAMQDAVARERVAARSSTSSSGRSTGRRHDAPRASSAPATLAASSSARSSGVDADAGAAGSAGRTLEGTARASRPIELGGRRCQPPVLRCARAPSSIQASTTFSRKSGLPPVRSASPARHVHGGSSAPGKRAARYAPTSAASSGAQVEARAAQAAQREVRVATRWITGSRVAASAVRKRADDEQAGRARGAGRSRRAGSSVEASLQCRSSSHSTSGRARR